LWNLCTKGATKWRICISFQFWSKLASNMLTRWNKYVQHSCSTIHCQAVVWAWT
jgi:hypothetical protein